MPTLEPIYLLYDKRMLQHRPIGWVEPEIFPEYLDDIDDDYPMENPERLRVIFDRLCGLETRLLRKQSIPDLIHADGPVFKRLSCERASKEQISLVHSKAYYEHLSEFEHYTNKELAEISYESRHDIYYNHESFNAALLAAGGLLACVQAVCNDPVTNKSIALVRPPGHHACQSKEMGFCFINSVAVAAKHAIASQQARRVCILDWDIHDGNGTAEATIKDPNIFRIDIHRFNRREGFYPYTGPPNEIGTGNAKGLNLNLAWSEGGMRNTEYAAAFYALILPLLVDFNPDLLIISCGLDAAMGDLLGGCELTPGFFHAMTRATIEAVGPKTPIVCALEGGYTMSVIPNCMEAVTLAMLNCPYSYHSSSSSAFGGGAAMEKTPPPQDPLTRARHTISKYYIPEASRMLLYSAVQDINYSIKIFNSVGRWAKVGLRPILGPPKPRDKKRKSQVSVRLDNGFQRPRVYMWYGTEEWHQLRRFT